ncbi:MAG: YidC/Oxa1 family membrane protein insertase, partial [Thermoleophilaceae bacterium]|nr:YidC/Oxa1 family membrane protein insertase [Thermoleophilaceae bacterium]
MIQAALDGLGSVLAFLYDVVPNYGVAIILFTLGIRVLLLPLGIKQVRSMHALSSVQPRVKAIQQKYKGNRQKISEETMALYKEHGVNPLSGCLPVLAQLPILFALFAVLQVPKGMTHIPRDSGLYTAIASQDTQFLGANLLCNASQAGRQVDVINDREIPDAPDPLNCGSGIPVRIPYYLFALVMIGTTFYQQRQMQRASPGNSPQQQMLTRIMPLLFGFWGFIFPAALVVYWTTTNLVQIGQQHFLLRERARSEAATGTRAGLVDGKTAGKTTGKQAGAAPRGSVDGKRSTGKSSTARPTGKTGAGRTGSPGSTRRPRASGGGGVQSGGQSG